MFYQRFLQILTTHKNSCWNVQNLLTHVISKLLNRCVKRTNLWWTCAFYCCYILALISVYYCFWTRLCLISISYSKDWHLDLDCLISVWCVVQLLLCFILKPEHLYEGPLHYTTLNNTIQYWIYFTSVCFSNICQGGVDKKSWWILYPNSYLFFSSFFTNNLVDITGLSRLSEFCKIMREWYCN